MILVEQTNTKPITLNGFAIKQVASPLIIPIVPEVDGCDCSDCEYYEYAFKGVDEDTNDTTSILITYPKAPTTKEYKLVKDGTDIIIDNTIAEIFLRGTMSVEDKEGFIVDWGKVYDLHGSGVYYINVKYNMLGVDYETKSHNYRVMTYNKDIAEDTYRIEFIKDGYFEDGRDYSGLNWSEKTRLNGYFGNKKSEIEIDSYINGSRIDEIIQRDLYFTYESTVFIPLHIQKNMFEGSSFNCFVSTYNQKVEIYKKLNVIFEEISLQEYKNQKNRLFSIVARDKKRDNIKRY